jgi:predicted acetyltransferase
MAFLAPPSERYKASFLAALREYQAEGRYHEYDPAVLELDFAWFVKFQLNKRVNPQPGRVKESVFWLVEGDEFIGRTALRHELNANLRLFGGNIGYDIRPSKRRQGYGTLICKLALDEARKIGLRRVMITCDEDNIGSRKIIEANGGKFEKAIQLKERTTRTLHFWVELDEGKAS